MLFSVIIFTIIYLNIQSQHSKNIANLSKEFIETNKKVIDIEVDRVHEYISYQENLTKKNINFFLKEKIDYAYNLIEKIYNENKNKSHEEIMKLIKYSLNDIRFNFDTYYFIYTLDGTNLMHPILKNIEGKNLTNFQDMKGTYMLREMRNLLTLNDEVFYEWYWKKENDTSGKEYLKTGYFKKFKPMDIFIGMGIFVDNFEEKLKQDIINYINNIKLSNNGYIFILDNKGTLISFPNKNYIGKNVYNIENKDGVKVVQEFINTTKNNLNRGFIEYHVPKSIDKDEPKKITYVKSFEKWNWIIGSGFLIKDLEDKILEKEKELEKSNNEYSKLVFATILIATFIVSLFSIFLSKKLEKSFLKYKDKINEQHNNNLEKDRLLSQKLKMASLGEMLHNIAHQWKQPLSGISTASSGLALKYEMGLVKNNDIQETTETITNLSNYLANTLENFKNFFKPTSPKEIFSLKENLNNCIHIVESDLLNSNVILKVKSENIKIHGYANDMMQIFINLINNAKDALEHNKSINEKYIFINIYEENNQAIINIKDNAGGISDENIHRIFEPYFTTKHQFNGTGIGLYMVKEILEKHMDTTISVKNSTYKYKLNEYKGAEFEIKIDIER